MATYAIGDIQGCYQDLHALLKLIRFKPATDTLWLCGDLINRGPQSLDVLRYLSELSHLKIVLGNHDLHFLALEAEVAPPLAHDTLEELLSAPDCALLCKWLRRQSLLHYDEALGFLMVHAGLASAWDLATAQKLALEVEALLHGPHYRQFLQNMYTPGPLRWREDLSTEERVQFSVNCLTRIRLCDQEGTLYLQGFKNHPSAYPHLIPWFKVPGRKTAHIPIIFGHWSTLKGQVDAPNLYALDTGCVWGESLTALKLEDKRLFQVACKQHVPLD